MLNDAIGLALTLVILGAIVCSFAGFGSTQTAVGRIRLTSSMRERLMNAAIALDADGASLPADTMASRILTYTAWSACLLSAFFMTTASHILLNAAALAVLLVLGLFLPIYRAVKGANAAGERHVAIVEQRRPWSAVPVYVFALALIAALSPLYGVGASAYEWPAVVACLAPIALLYLGFRFAAMPARLLGEDILAERLIDGRIRCARARGMIILSFLLSAMALAASRSTAPPLEVGAVFLTAMVATSVWNLWSLYAKPSEAELRELETAPTEMSA